MIDPGEAVAAVERLSAAFAGRDVAAAMACFVPADDIGYAGSERGERAAGRAAVRALLTEVFARDEAYSWRVTDAVVRGYGAGAYVLAEATGTVDTDAGGTESFAYRVSGMLEPAGGQWLWRYCQGCEPTGA
jgi:ketosteroid isomerase-like protein